MVNYQKKTFFRRPTEAQIRNGHEQVLLERNLIATLERLGEEEYAEVPFGLINLESFGGPKTFMKSGPHVPLHRFRSIDHAVYVAATPTQLLFSAVRNPKIMTKYRSGYTFRPVMGDDKRFRKVFLFEVMEAARLMAYGKAIPMADLVVDKNYTDTSAVSKEGGKYLVTTPSRRKKHRRHAFTVSGIPVVEQSKFIFASPFSFSTEDVGIESKTFRDLRYEWEEGRESGIYHYVQAHEIAATYAIAESELEQDNSAPYNFIVFPVPTQRLIVFCRNTNINCR